MHCVWTSAIVGDALDEADGELAQLAGRVVQHHELIGRRVLVAKAREFDVGMELANLDVDHVVDGSEKTLRGHARLEEARIEPRQIREEELPEGTDQLVDRLAGDAAGGADQREQILVGIGLRPDEAAAFGLERRLLEERLPGIGAETHRDHFL